MAGSASAAIIISRDDAQAAEAGPDIHPGKRQEEAGAGEQSHQRYQIGGRRNASAVRECRHQRRRQPDRGEHQIRRGAEQPGGVFRQHHFLLQQPQQVAVRLHQRRTSPPDQPRLEDADEARQSWRQHQHQRHLNDLENAREQGLDDHHCDTATMTRSAIRAKNISDR